MDVTGHLEQAGREVVEAAKVAGHEVGQELTKLDITIETFIRAHCNSQGKHVDDIEDELASVFSRAIDRVRGVTVG